MKKRDKCGDCLYFDDIHLECRKNSPIPQFAKIPKDIINKWPSVEPDDWCGEFRAARCFIEPEEPIEI